MWQVDRCFLDSAHAREHDDLLQLRLQQDYHRVDWQYEAEFVEPMAWVSEVQSPVVGSTAELFLELRDQEDWPLVHFAESRLEQQCPRLEVWARFVEHELQANRFWDVRCCGDDQHLDCRD